MSVSRSHKKRDRSEENWDNTTMESPPRKSSRNSGLLDVASEDLRSRMTSDAAKPSATPDFAKVAVIVEKRKEDLTEWISGRLQEHSWNDSPKKAFREKLSGYQAVQINGHEKNLTELLVKHVGVEARSKLPDDIKQELVAAVQDFLQEKDEFLQYYRRTRRKAKSTSSR
ncbi:hypothetical protein RvY_15735 [Ramazzottius varieornatus]|uniref:Transcription and mRNA export factor ENY2 n=1 Tax=Ramazzottius varieornatus TaxID=947166 RepID=A0A1D1VVZ5_RAMVA|nr:hypothetical protein RvY_15735 [Ramazzottius varieornatus]